MKRTYTFHLTRPHRPPGREEVDWSDLVTRGDARFAIEADGTLSIAFTGPYQHLLFLNGEVVEALEKDVDLEAALQYFGQRRVF